MAALLVDRFRRKIPLHDGRGAHHQSPRGHILCDDRSSGDQSTCSNSDAIQNDGANSHQASVVQRRAMDHSPVANGDVSTNAHRLPWITMKDGAILNVAPRSDADLFQITASHSHGPEAAALSHPDVADYNSRIGDPSVRIDLGIGPGLRASHDHGSATTSFYGDLSDNLIWCHKWHAQAGTGR